MSKSKFTIKQGWGGRQKMAALDFPDSVKGNPPPADFNKNLIFHRSVIFFHRLMKIEKLTF